MNKRAKAKKKKKKRKVLPYVLGTLGIMIALAVITGGIFIYHYRSQIEAAKQEAADKLASINDTTFRRISPTVIYDKNGNKIAKLSSSDYVYTKYSDIPELARDAFIATEDKDFFKNKGVSVRGMGRALVSYIKNKGKITEGGSTITQQLVKNVLLTQDRTWSRKITEILISLQLEKKYTKEQILEYYLNNINFANGANSIAAAAHTYFNKPLNDLNLAETTFIAAIPNNPTYYNPLKYYAHVVTRQHLMLYNLKAQNYITSEQYNQAMNTKIVLNYQPPKSVNENYMTSYAMDSAIKALMQNDGFDFKYQFASESERKDYESLYSETYSDYDKKIRSGGYNIYTSLDADKENQLQASLDKGLTNFTATDPKTGLYKMQGAAVCIDNSTGQVIAEVGGRSQQNVTNYFNRAFLAVRQPGSAIKPVLVYTPAFDKGYMPDDTMVDQYIPNGPKNDENTFFGQVTLRYATEMSLNTIAYQLLQQISPQYAIPYLYKMDFAHIVKQDYSPIAGIGGLTYGVTPVELAGAYSTIERGGEFIQPTCITKIEGEIGNIIYENPRTKVRVYKEDSTYYMTDVLKGVITKSWGTGYGLGLDNMTSAGKTGTTSSSKDGWFAGYTPYYTTVVWTGYDTPTAISSLYGATYPGHIWQSFMNKAHVGLQPKDFAIPDAIQQALDEKAQSDAQNALNDAENAVSAYEAVNINSKADYAAAASALQKAQSAVNKLPDDKKQAFQDRIDVKSNDLTKEKQAVETDAEGATNSTQTNNTTANGSTTTNNSTGTNNTGGNTTNNTTTNSSTTTTTDQSKGTNSTTTQNNKK